MYVDDINRHIADPRSRAAGRIVAKAAKKLERASWPSYRLNPWKCVAVLASIVMMSAIAVIFFTVVPGAVGVIVGTLFANFAGYGLLGIVLGVDFWIRDARLLWRKTSWSLHERRLSKYLQKGSVIVVPRLVNSAWMRACRNSGLREELADGKKFNALKPVCSLAEEADNPQISNENRRRIERVVSSRITKAADELVWEQNREYQVGVKLRAEEFSEQLRVSQEEAIVYNEGLSRWLDMEEGDV
jgi:hypothetical protein